MRVYLSMLSLLLVGSVVPSNSQAEDCAQYLNKARESRQRATEESGKQVQGDYHRQAAQAYTNAAAKYDAEYRRCLGGQGGSLPPPPAFSGPSTNDAILNMYQGLNNILEERRARERAQESRDRAARQRGDQEFLDYLNRPNTDISHTQDELSSYADSLVKSKRSSQPKPDNPSESQTFQSAQRLVSGPTPAFSGEGWTPWYALKDLNGSDIAGLDIAYWFGSAQPSSFAKDFPTQWIIRNRNPSRVKLTYELLIQCMEQCGSGWYSFAVEVPSQGSRAAPTKYLYQVLDNRIRSMTIGTP